MFLITVISSIFFQQLGSEAIFPAANLLFLSLSDAIDSYEMPSQILEFHHVCEATIAPSKTDNFMANNLVFRWPKTLSFSWFWGGSWYTNCPKCCVSRVATQQVPSKSSHSTECHVEPLHAEPSKRNPRKCKTAWLEEMVEEKQEMET